MINKYFNSPVITPLVKASAQHAAFAEGDIVFQWAPFDIPKGASRLLGATITTRHNKVANQAGTLDLLFAKDNGTNSTPTQLGGGNALFGLVEFGRTDIVGFLPGKLADMAGEGVQATAANYQTSDVPSGIVLESDVRSGTNVGYDRYYVAGLSSGALDLRGLVAIGPSEGVDISGSDGTFDIIDGTDPLTVFAVGDLLHAQDDIIVGEIEEMNTDDILFKFSGETSTNHSGTYTVPANIAAWRIQNGAGAAGDLLENDILYNVFPIRITLHFEK
jgi:hypothetical protein